MQINVFFFKKKKNYLLFILPTSESAGVASRKTTHGNTMFVSFRRIRKEKVVFNEIGKEKKWEGIQLFYVGMFESIS